MYRFKNLVSLIILLFLVSCAGTKTVTVKSWNPRYVVTSNSTFSGEFCARVAKEIGGFYVPDKRLQGYVKKYIVQTTSSDFHNQKEVIQKGNWVGADYLIRLEGEKFKYNSTGGIIKATLLVYDIYTSQLVWVEHINVHNKLTPALVRLALLPIHLLTADRQEQVELMKAKLEDELIEEIKVRNKSLKKQIWKNRGHL